MTFRSVSRAINAPPETLLTDRLAEGSGRNGRPSVFYQIVPAMLEKKTSRYSNARVLDRELFIAIHIPILD